MCPALTVRSYHRKGPLKLRISSVISKQEYPSLSFLLEEERERENLSFSYLREGGRGPYSRMQASGFRGDKKVHDPLNGSRWLYRQETNGSGSTPTTREEQMSPGDKSSYSLSL